MAYVYMNRVNYADTNYSAEGYNQRRFEYTESLNSAGIGNVIICPPNVKGETVTLEVIAGSGKVELSTDPLNIVLAGSGIFTDWSAATVTSTTQTYIAPITALRMVNVSGTTKIKVIAD